MSRIKFALVALIAALGMTAGFTQKAQVAQKQHRGVKIAKALALSSDQVAAIKTIRHQTREQVVSVKKSNEATEVKRENIKALRQERRAKVLNVLTPSQRAKLETIRKRHKKSA